MSDADILFRPELAILLPWEVVCEACRYTFYHRLPGCPDPDCTAHKPLH